MSDFFSHDLFGTRMLTSLPIAAQQAAGAHPAAYRWGLHGPDPLFFRKVMLGSPLHKLGNRMHSEKTGKLFVVFSDAVGRLKGENRLIGEAYFYGFLCHYALDSVVHPYVYYHQNELAALDDTRSPSIIHCQIETDIDWALCEQETEHSILDFDFEQRYALTVQEAAVLSVLLHHLLLKVYETDVPTAELRAAFTEMLNFQLAFYHFNPTLAHTVGAVEHVIRQNGVLTSHLKQRAPGWDCLNLDHRVWYNLWEPGKERIDSVPDLFDRAEKRASVLASNYSFQFEEGWQMNLSFYDPFDCGNPKKMTQE